ncbi:hypothetical protein Droror1_Dr00002113 [Drosera rotundifolia]
MHVRALLLAQILFHLLFNFDDRLRFYLFGLPVRRGDGRGLCTNDFAASDPFNPILFLMLWILNLLWRLLSKHLCHSHIIYIIHAARAGKYVSSGGIRIL